MGTKVGGEVVICRLSDQICVTFRVKAMVENMSVFNAAKDVQLGHYVVVP